MKKALLICTDSYPNGDAGAVRTHIFAKMIESLGFEPTIVGMGKTTNFKFKTYENIGEYKIVNKNTMDGLKLLLDDGSWILIRKSGTEPLLRIYFESDKEEKITELETLVKQLC